MHFEAFSAKLLQNKVTPQIYHSIGNTTSRSFSV